MPNNSAHIAEVDFVRGTAIVMMLASNFVTDLQYFYNYSKYEMFWQVFATITASIFLLIVGISLNLSYSRDAKVSKFIKRGAGIFALGLIITAVTWIFVPQDFIMFGILHLIGLSIVISYPFLKLDKKFALVAGMAFLIVGFFVTKVIVSNNYLMWVGFTTASFSSPDYFPIFPWFGLVLIGLFLGKWLYPEGKRIFEVPEIKSKPILWLGRHSLLIYMIHQPIFLGLLALII
jgi:uncharacterized membrane protein